MTEQSAKAEQINTLNDRDLLRRFIHDSDQLAFAEIVHRYQQLVLGVCRRVIGHPADVEDAFQATFIALARRPRQNQRTRSLSSWLYTVAWRTSWKLIRQRRENPVEQLSHHPLVEAEDPLDRIAAAQDCLVMDEELNGLPERYRDVLVMTYFSSQTSQEIADGLNVSKGTVDGRLRQARNMLRTRLARRGVGVGVLAFAASLSQGSSAAASPALVESTVQLGLQAISGSQPGSPALPNLEPLIHAESAMLSTKLILSVLLCGSAVIGVVAMNGVAQEPNPLDSDNVLAINTSVADDDPFGSSDDSPSDPFGIQSDVVVNGDEVYEAEAQPAQATVSDAADAVSEAVDDIPWAARVVKGMPGIPANTPISEVLDVLAEHTKTKIVIDRAAGRAVTSNTKLNGLPAIEAIRTALSGCEESFVMEVLEHDSSAVIEIGTASVPAYPLWSADARPVERWMYSTLERELGELEFPGEYPLSEVLDMIVFDVNSRYGRSATGDFQLRYHVDVAELDIEGVTSIEDVTVRDLVLSNLTLRSALKLLFEQTQEPQMTYEIRDEVMVITTVARAESDDALVTRIYDVGNVLKIATPREELSQSYIAGDTAGLGQLSASDSGQAKFAAAAASGSLVSNDQKKNGGPSHRIVSSEEQLVMLVTEMTEPPARWLTTAGEGGTINYFGNKIVVRQTVAVHYEIGRLLTALSSDAEE